MKVNNLMLLYLINGMINNMSLGASKNNPVKYYNTILEYARGDMRL